MEFVISMSTHRIYDMTFKSIYNAYVNKVTRKNRSTQELDEILRWMGGYTEEEFQNILDNEEMTMREFFEDNDHLNPSRLEVTGTICGVKIAELEDPLMKDIRIMDKIVDELARGKAIEKIKR